MQTDDDDALNETKIDVPDSWVRGFLQVSSAMTLPAYYFDLHPMDIHNICFLLRRRRETQGLILFEGGLIVEVHTVCPPVEFPVLNRGPKGHAV